ncbi:MAG: hypothetical protein H7Y04_09025 [Verrucomicrobia bacterium]|nr:hypothetical protein [Cytophagales bacterium]
MIEESKIIPVNQKENLAFAIRFFLTLAFSILNGYFFIWINGYFNFKVNQEDIQELKLKDKIMVLLLIAPIVETLILQYIPIQIVRY